MRAAVRVIGPFRNVPHGAARLVAVDLAPGSRVIDAIRAVGIRDDEPWNASVTGRLVDGEQALRDGDEILVFPPLGGGALDRQ